MRTGRLVTIEGLDGAGKTTLAASLAAALRERGMSVTLLREPGGVQAAERVRELVTDPALRIAPRAEALLYAAARAQLVEDAILPLLASGEWVLVDRFVDSSLAYQGAGRSLGIEAIRTINEFATEGIRPDRTLLLDVDPPVGRERSSVRGGTRDRLEREDEAFFRRIAAGYAELAAAEPDRIRLIDGGQDPQQVVEAALAELADLL
jgi:dTMP kinase